MRFVYKNHKRQKYVCGCGGGVDTAIGPDKLVPGGRDSVDFAIYVAMAKYTDHVPLERQVRRMARDGLAVTSATLRDQIERPLRERSRERACWRIGPSERGSVGACVPPRTRLSWLSTTRSSTLIHRAPLRESPPVFRCRVGPAE